jgi:hypothetical protein
MSAETEKVVDKASYATTERLILLSSAEGRGENLQVEAKGNSWNPTHYILD